MKVFLKTILVLGVSMLLLALTVSYVGGVPTLGTNYVRTHTESSSMQNSECVKCHNTLTENGRDTEGGNIPGAHRRHFLSIFLNFENIYSLNSTMVADNDPILYGCAHCHAQTIFKGMGTRNSWTGGTGFGLGFGQSIENDLSYDSANGTGTPPAGRQVDPEICRFCHGKIADGSTHIAAGVDSDTYCGGEGGSSCHWSGVWSPQVQHDPSVIGSTGIFIDNRYTNSMTYCNLCHGGPYVWFQEAQGIGVGCSISLCHDTLTSTQVQGSHEIHFADGRGPELASSVAPCDRCHGPGASAGAHAGHTDGIVNFGDGFILASTSVCDDCHSPSGGYNGVVSTGVSVGAKDNWLSGVYIATDTLDPSKDNWCLGCHDSAPSIINAPATGDTTMSAPGIGGDGSSFGFDINGHGVSTSASYDKDSYGDAAGNPGAEKACFVDCHDITNNHLNSVDNTDTTWQRLKSSVNSTLTTTVFEVCIACHQNPGGTSTSTTQVSTHGNSSAGGYGPAIEAPFVVECQTCHEVHGNNWTSANSQHNLKMVRSSINSTEVVFSATSGADSFDEDGADTSDADDICVTCHIITSNPGYPMTNHSGGQHISVGDQRGNNCTSCHGHDYKLDGIINPFDGFMPYGCSGCHTYPPGSTETPEPGSTYDGSQSHLVHVNTYEYGCEECHNDFPVGHNQSEVIDKFDWAANFNPDLVDVVFSTETNPFGYTTTETVTNAPDRNRQCLDLYCHGQKGDLLSTLVTTQATTDVSKFGVISADSTDIFPIWSDLPTWDDGDSTSGPGAYSSTNITGACGTCHDNFRDNNNFPEEVIATDTTYPFTFATWDNTTTRINDWSAQLSGSPGSAATVWDITPYSSIGSLFQSDFGWDGYKTHLDTARGPRLTCYPCHPIPPSVIGYETTTGPIVHVDKYLDFMNDINSGSTTRGIELNIGSTETVGICGNVCHSALGEFNGVNDIDIGAITNWPFTVLTTSTPPALKAGKENWCMGCHDSAPITIPGFPNHAPPNIAGNNVSYGFNVTGHGLESSQSYSGDSYGDTNGNSGAGKQCLDCHDDRRPHLDGEDGTRIVDLRLRSVINGISVDPTGQLFFVCKACHQNNGPEASSIRVSSHGNETSGTYSPIEEPFLVQCWVCHSPHGNETNTEGKANLRMIRANIWGNDIVFLNTTGTDSFDEVDSNDQDDICASCHTYSNPTTTMTIHAGGNDHLQAGDQRGSSCVVCHSHDYKSDGNILPNDGFMPIECDDCHTYPAGGTQGTYKGSKTHTVHVVTYNFDCNECHLLTGNTHNQSGVTSADDWMDGIGNDFDPANVDLLFDSTNPGGFTAVTVNGFDRNRQCLNLYCHGQTDETITVGLWENGDSRDITFADLGGTNKTFNIVETSISIPNTTATFSFTANTIPTWDNPNNSAIANRYEGTYLSGSCGTCHDSVRDNTSIDPLYPTWQSPPGTSTTANDWSSATNWNEPTIPPLVWDITSSTSIGSLDNVPPSSELMPNIAHRYHLDEIQGPMVVCNACHMTPPTVIGGSTATVSDHVNRQIDFKDGATSLATTIVCGTCHANNQAAGAFDGVTMAKDYFRTGIYNQTTDSTPFESELPEATEEWCVTCHDDEAPTIRGVTAPAAGGDNSTYGFFATGHGRNNLVQCHDCHDTKDTRHIDQDQRTYAYSSASQSSEIYRTGYRLKTVDSAQPLIVPLNSGTSISPVENFALCYSCHNESNITSAVALQETNFRSDKPDIMPLFSWPMFWFSDDILSTGATNNHQQMMTGSVLASPKWDSDWDEDTSITIPGEGIDSWNQCLTCHNVHGSTYNAMMRDGMLVNRDIANGRPSNGLEYGFIKSSVTTPTNWATVSNFRNDSIGGVVRFDGAVENRGICATNGCHAISGVPASYEDYQIDTLIANQIDYYRDPIPIPLSAVFDSTTTLSIVFSEAINATNTIPYTNIVGTITGALSPASLTSIAIDPSKPNVVKITLNKVIDMDEKGTLDIGVGGDIFDSYDLTKMTTPITGQKIWDGINP